MVDISNLGVVLEAIQEGVMIVDNDYTIQYYNSAMGKIDGYTPDEVIGKKILDIFPYQTYEKNTIMQAFKEQKSTINKVQHYVTGKGKQNSIITSTLPILKNGKVIGVVETCKNISSERKLIEDLIDMSRQLKNNSSGENGDSVCRYTFDDIIGKSDVLLDAIKYAKRVSKTDSFVLISGETGTGKELFAQSIHNNSLRKNKPFIAVNCAALPGELLESILFGTMRGGFTGSTDREGLFEEANHGTLLLDEIDSMDLNLQAKLLRVLQDGVVRRVGGNKDIPLNVRVISTVNSNMTELINSGKFRTDLYYRISVVNLTIPPLKDRGDDILILANLFIEQLNPLFGKNVKGLSEEVNQLFKEYSWPGNVREMKHCIEGIMNIVENDDEIKLENLPSNFLDPIQIENHNHYSNHSFSTQSSLDHSESINNGSLRSITDSIEKESIIKALEKTKGNVSEAAKLVGMKRQTLQYKMNKFGITKNNLTVHWDT